jgi:hypothetical protein
MKIKQLVQNTLVGLLMLVAPMSLAVPSVAYADVDASKQAACAGIGLASADGGCGGGADNRVFKVVATVVNVLSIIVGIAAVIMIIVSGFRYITSGGDSSKVSGAKSALIYAIVGLVVVALSQVIVRFVLNNV